MNVGFVLGNFAYIVLCLDEHMTTYSGFMDGAIHNTLNLELAAWVFYSPIGELVSSGGTCLGPVSNNLRKYHAVIGLLTEALTNDVS